MDLQFIIEIFERWFHGEHLSEDEATHNGDDLHEKWHIVKEVYGVNVKK